MTSRRVDSIQLSGIRKLFEMATEGSINLGLGEPDFQPPKEAIEGVIKAMEDGKNKYGPTAGIPELREAIAQRLHRYREDLSTGNVIVTSSATEALMSIFQSLFQEGDEILIPDPGFVLYPAHTTIAGAKPVYYTLKEDNGFEPDIEEIKSLIGPNTKGMVINSPGNPTGGVFSVPTVKAISELSADRGFTIIADEVYDEMVYDGSFTSFLSHAENVVHVNSFSKTFAMTGWRIGYAASPDPELMTAISKMHYYTVACPPTPIQYGALEAMRRSQYYIDEMVSAFRERRDIIVKELNSTDGFHTHSPKGAFYVLPSFDFDMSSEELSMLLLKHGVLSSPGSAFGRAGEGHIRFSYANSKENIMEAMRRVREAISNI